MHLHFLNLKSIKKQLDNSNHGGGEGGGERGEGRGREREREGEREGKRDGRGEREGTLQRGHPSDAGTQPAPRSSWSRTCVACYLSSTVSLPLF